MSMGLMTHQGMLSPVQETQWVHQTPKPQQRFRGVSGDQCPIFWIDLRMSRREMMTTTLSFSMTGSRR